MAHPMFTLNTTFFTLRIFSCYLIKCCPFSLDDSELIDYDHLYICARLQAKFLCIFLCGYRIEEIDDEFELYKQCRRMEKLIDELARGRKMENILREEKK